jgi:GNAT superfamily N-acetyltransferase
MVIEIRLLEEADAPHLYLLGQENHAADAQSVLEPMDPEKSAIVMAQQLMAGLAIGAFEGDQLVGTLVLIEHEPWYSRAKRLYGLFFYVRPQWRKTRAAELLRQGAEAIADDMGERLELDDITAREIDRKSNWYERRGYERIGCIWLRRAA